MYLQDLVGKRVLDAVDFSTESIKSWGDQYDDCEVCRFRLDGNVYAAVEDPDDGYRSHMRELAISEDTEMKNVFPEIEVVARHREKGEYHSTDDVLELIDVATGRCVLEVGTENTDDYYPYYVAKFDPAAMSTNSQGE